MTLQNPLIVGKKDLFIFSKVKQKGTDPHLLMCKKKKIVEDD